VFFAVSWHGVEKPFMIMKSDLQIPENPDNEFKKMVTMIRKYESDFISHSAHVYRIVIQGAKHTNFSDQPLYDENVAGRINTKLCHELIKELTKAFFDRYVLGKKEIELEKLAESYPEIQFKKF